jgi:hypothetical protein
LYQCCQHIKSIAPLFVQCYSSLSVSTYGQKLYNVSFVNSSTARSIFPPRLLFGTALLAAYTGTHKLWLRFAQLGLFVCDVCRAWRCGCTPTSPVGVTSNKSLLCRLRNRTTPSPPPLAETQPSHIISTNLRTIHPFTVVSCYTLFPHSCMKTLSFPLVYVQPLLPLSLCTLRTSYLV